MNVMVPTMMSLVHMRDLPYEKITLNLSVTYSFSPLVSSEVKHIAQVRRGIGFHIYSSNN